MCFVAQRVTADGVCSHCFNEKQRNNKNDTTRAVRSHTHATNRSNGKNKEQKQQPVCLATFQ